MGQHPNLTEAPVTIDTGMNMAQTVANNCRSEASSESSARSFEWSVAADAVRGIKIGAAAFMPVTALFFVITLAHSLKSLSILGLWLATTSIFGAAILASRTALFLRHWRAITLAFAGALTIAFGAEGAIVHDQNVAVVWCVVISFGAATFIPWEMRYQLVLNSMCLLSIGGSLLFRPVPQNFSLLLTEATLISTVLLTEYSVFFLSSARRAAFENLEKLRAREGELVKKNAELEVLTNNVVDILVALDDTGRMLELSLGIERTLGYARAELMGGSVFDYVHEKDREVVAAALAAAIAAPGKVESVQCRLRHKSAGWRTIAAVGQAVPAKIADNQNSQNTIVVVSFRDITESIEQDRTQALWSAFAKSSDDALVAASLEGIFTNWNPGAQRLFGYSADEMIGRHLSAFIPPDLLDETREVVDRVSRGEVVRDLETQRTRKDGTRLHVSLTGFPMINAAGQVAGMAAIVRDVTERKRAEDKFRSLLESAPDAMVIVDSGGRITLVNAQVESLFGHKREQLLGKPVEMLMPERFRGNHVAHRLRFAASPQMRPMGAGLNLLGRRADGSEFPVEIRLSPLRSEGELLVASAIRDITRQKEVERELIAARESALAASRAKSEFLSSMSHEIRTPMNMILGMAEVLGETPLGPDQRRYINLMKSNSNTLLRLINDILDLAKIESGKFGLEQVEFDLEELVETTAETMSVRAHEKGIELVTRISHDLPRRRSGDPLRLRQILTNFLSNAIKFTESGEVVVTVEKDPAADGEGALLFSVADTGVGIPADKQDAIFSSFTQADSSITRKYGGTGLGLTIVRRLTEMMGGRVWLESAPGKGSIFHLNVKLPAQASSPAAAIKPNPPAGLHLLAIDDSRSNRMALREMLPNCELAEATDAETAVRALDNARRLNLRYDLVMIDWRIPGTDAAPLLQQISSHIAAPMPIIVMLPSHDLNSQTAWVSERKLHYVVKPIKQSDLYATIALALLHTPLSVDPPAPTRSESGVIEKKTPLRILVADDSPDNRLLIELYLKHTPHRLDHAENGEVAVRKFKAGEYDLILMDNQMPVMDGLTAVRTIRQIEREKHAPPVPIVAVTASALDEDVDRSREAGCNIHLSKPLNKAKLLEAIEAVTGAGASITPPG